MTATVPAPRSAVGPGAVQLTDNGLLIRSLLVREPEILSAARTALARGDDLDAWLLLLLRTGAVAVTAAGSNSDLSRVERAVESLGSSLDYRVTTAMSKLEHTIDKAVDPQGGTIAVASQAAVSRLSEGVGRMITGPSATLPETVRASVQSVTDPVVAEINRGLAANAAANRQAITAERDALLSAMRADHHQVQLALGELRTALAVTTAVAQVERGTPAAGLSYEDDCVELIGRIAAAACDGGAEATGNAIGRDGDRVGDATVSLTSLGLDPCPVLVIEAKARAGSHRPSARGLASELTRAMSNRAASVALALCPSQRMPVLGQKVVVLGKNMVAVAYDPADANIDLVTAAYQLLRLIAATERADVGAEGVDIGDLRHRVAQLRASLITIDTLERQLSASEKALGKVRQTTTGLKTDLIEHVAELTRAVKA